jgi:hypothetical protein
VKRIWRLAAGWDRFWFGPESPLNLAAARIVVSAHALWILLSRDPAGIAALPPEFWTAVRASSRWRFLVFEGQAGLERALQALAVAALLAALAGLWPRVSCLLAGLLLYHLAPYETLVYTPSPWVKGYTITTLALVVLSFAPCADAWSVRPRPQAAPAAAYNWPLKLVQLFLCQVYLFAGYAKLFRTGLAWVSAEGVRGYVLLYNQSEQNVVFNTIGPWLAAHPRLCLAAAVAAMLINFSFWIVLFSRRARRVLVPVAVVWHLGILLAMNIAFLEAPLLLLFVDWAALRARLGGRLPAPAPAAASA